MSILSVVFTSYAYHITPNFYNSQQQLLIPFRVLFYWLTLIGSILNIILFACMLYFTNHKIVIYFYWVAFLTGIILVGISILIGLVAVSESGKLDSLQTEDQRYIEQYVWSK